MKIDIPFVPHSLVFLHWTSPGTGEAAMGAAAVAASANANLEVLRQGALAEMTGVFGFSKFFFCGFSMGFYGFCVLF